MSKATHTNVTFSDLKQELTFRDEFLQSRLDRVSSTLSAIQTLASLTEQTDIAAALSLVISECEEIFSNEADARVTRHKLFKRMETLQ